jgi:superfamily I DNA/RNA helicase
MKNNVENELNAAIDQILISKSRRRLVVAGPGTGKTTLFKKLLESSPGSRKTRLVLTFIANLKDDLEHSLGSLARVSTLHGYCQYLLRRHSSARGGLTEQFRCVPEMASLVKRDWEYLRESPSPSFVAAMRSMNADPDLGFYFDRANYYDAVDFDDSVFRTLQALSNHPNVVEQLDLLLIDEFQDFNRMEANFIELLASKNSIVIAGDDDQALYSQLRDASWEHIRALHDGGQYQVFALPFCMRCPEVIVSAVGDVITKARELLKLQGRIEKPYKHFEPKKGADSRRYPKIVLVETTVQRANANYFGRYIERSIRAISQNDSEEAARSREPTVLIIGPRQYGDPVRQYLVDQGFTVEGRADHAGGVQTEIGLEILAEDAAANVGWRIVLENEASNFAATCIRGAAKDSVGLASVIPADFRKKALAAAIAWKTKSSEVVGPSKQSGESKEPRIKVTSFEGSKGLSAQHVFILGMHAGDLPRDSENIKDLEVCKFLVGLTRTKKLCTLLYTRRFADQVKSASPFLRWIRKERFNHLFVDAAYWIGKSI